MKSAPVVLSIDPGKKHNGWALFAEGQLVALGLAKGQGALETAENTQVQVSHALNNAFVYTLVIEAQEIYRGPTRKNPNDMLEVAFASGALAALFEHCTLIRPLPRVWTKGQKKEIRQQRLLDPLRSPMSDEELSIVLGFKAPKTLKHNVIDAVALGLYALKRL